MKCKDCGSTTRKLSKPGPRCATCKRARVKEIKLKSHGRRIEATYGITPDQYWERYENQGGVCAICRRANGKTRRLSVDHDHACCPSGNSCGRCIRGLLCRPCNDMLGHARDSPEMMERAAAYLRQSHHRDTKSPASVNEQGSNRR